jgi:hypothetical protein
MPPPLYLAASWAHHKSRMQVRFHRHSVKSQVVKGAVTLEWSGRTGRAV